MNTIRILFFLLLFCHNNGFSDTIIDNLEKLYPGISFHINLVEKTEPALVSRENLKRLYDYINTRGQEIKKGMNLILLHKFYNTIREAHTINFIIDGKDNEWGPVPFYKIDPTGDGVQDIAGADMVLMKAFIDDEKNLYMLMKPTSPPDPGLIFQPLLYFNQTRAWEIQVLISGTYQIVKERIGDKKETRVVEGFKAATDDVYEVKLPLIGFLKARGDISFIHIWTGFFYGDNYDALAMRISPCLSNDAFLLLLYMLNEKCYTHNDAITLAIAYANNYLYSIAGKQTREAIKADMIRHYRLYKKINNWQKQSGLPYILESVPVIPKIFWAARHNKSDQLHFVHEAMDSLGINRMNLEIYREYIDRVDLLEKIYNQIIRKKITLNKNIYESAQHIEKAVYPIFETRYALWKYEDLYKRGRLSREEYEKLLKEAETEYEKEYFGVTRNWEQFRWNNYQFYKRYFKGKKLTGDCGTVTQAQLLFYKMAGICPVSCQRVNLTATFDYPSTHNFPAFYNPVLKRWSFVQIPGKNHKNYKPESMLSFSFNIPYMHHASYDKQKSIYEDKATSERTINFYQLGMREKEFEDIFINQNESPRETAIFTALNAPVGEVPDRDSDGLYDSIETELQTNPRYMDTDRDGVSDYWEVYHQYDPLDKKSPGKNTIAVDGMMNSFEKKMCVFTKDPKGDQPDGNKSGDIIRMGSFLSGTTLYLMAEVAAPLKKDIIFQPLLYLNGEKEWGIQVLISGYTQFVKERKEGVKELKEIKGFAFGAGDVYEISLPLSSFLENGESLKELRVWTGVFAGDSYDACSFYVLKGDKKNP